MARVTWTDGAGGELRRTMSRLERVAGRATARRWAARIRSAVALIAASPELGPPVEDVVGTGWREWFIGPYRLIYSFDGSVCEVQLFVRAERDLGGLLDDDE